MITHYSSREEAEYIKRKKSEPHLWVIVPDHGAGYLLKRVTQIKSSKSKMYRMLQYAYRYIFEDPEGPQYKEAYYFLKQVEDAKILQSDLETLEKVEEISRLEGFWISEEESIKRWENYQTMFELFLKVYQDEPDLKPDINKEEKP